jgi:translation initiation factor IF-2
MISSPQKNSVSSSVQTQVDEASKGQECGITLGNYHDLEEGDVIQCFVVKQVDRKLE